MRFHSSTGKHNLDVRYDLAQLGVGVATVETGESTSNLEEATMMSEMVARASQAAVLADSTKFGNRLFAQIASLGRASYFRDRCEAASGADRAFRYNRVEIVP